MTVRTCSECGERKEIPDQRNVCIACGLELIERRKEKEEKFGNWKEVIEDQDKEQYSRWKDVI